VSSPLLCRLSVSASSFSSVTFLGRSISRHATRILSDVAPSYSRFPSRVLIGFSLRFSSPAKKYFVWQVRIHRRNDGSEPFRRACIRVRPLSSCSHGLRDICVDKKSKIPVFSRLRIFEAKIPGGISSAPAPASLHPYLVSSRLCETRRSATNFGCVPFPSNSQEPLNETL
jgi:hypothetical protein